MKTPEQLRASLGALYPPSATCWSQATDEVRDLSRAARLMLGLKGAAAVDFRAIETPSEWNRQGIDSIVKWYAQMTTAQRIEYVRQNKHLLTAV